MIPGLCCNVAGPPHTGPPCRQQEKTRTPARQTHGTTRQKIISENKQMNQTFKWFNKSGWFGFNDKELFRVFFTLVFYRLRYNQKGN